MAKVYVYYESKNKKNDESTLMYIKVFENYKLAHRFLNKSREEYISKFKVVPHEIDGLGDKSWCRLLNSVDKNDYIDLIIEEKEIIKDV